MEIKKLASLRTESEIIANWKGNIDKPIVSICCITYNHEPYIEDALEGFLMQETNFPFEIVIRDDASTDVTADIIRFYEKKYPRIIKPIYEKENGYQKGVKPADVTISNATGKYIAFCEGDDYWTSSKKLQMQFDFLSNNDDFKFCWTRFKTFQQNSNVIDDDKNGDYFDGRKEIGVVFSKKEFCDTGWHIGMQTLMFEKDLRDPRIAQSKEYRDVFMLSDFLTKSDGFCLPHFCAVYRIHDRGIHSGINQWEQLRKSVEIYRSIAVEFDSQMEYKKKYFKYSNIYIFNLLKRNKISLIKGEIEKRKNFQTRLDIFLSFLFFFMKSVKRKISN